MILIKSATLVEKEHPLHLQKVDILIEDGIIKEISNNIEVQGDLNIIEKEDLHVATGFIDSSVSFGEPGFEERQTITNGLKAAAAGGFTHIMMNPNNQPNPQDRSGVDFVKNLSANHAVKVLPIGNLTINQEGEHLAELYDMQQAGAVAFYDPKKPVTNANLLKLALQYTSTFGGIVQSYPCDKSLAHNGQVHEDAITIHLGLKTQPALAEDVQVARDLAVHAYTNGQLHIPTLSLPQAVEKVALAKAKQKVTCSASIHHLVCDTQDLQTFDTNYKVKPPLRSVQERLALIDLVKAGKVDMLTSDHSPLNIEHKDVEFDLATSGTTGLESAFVCLLPILGVEKTVEMLTGAYRVFTKEEPKIAPGQKVNLALFSTINQGYYETSKQITTAQNSALQGKSTQGKVYGIINHNNVILTDE